MANRGSILSVAAALGLSALRLATLSPTPKLSAPPARFAAIAAAVEADPNSPPPPQAVPPFVGNCTAYASQPEGPIPPHGNYPLDANAGAAQKVLEKFVGKGGSFVTAQYAIALVPDPHHTNLSLMFDREMSILQHAVQDEGFEYDSSWMPWKVEKETPPSHLGDRQLAADLEDGRENCPGMLLFRRRHFGADTPASPYTEGLVVFVVGEQATGGINEGQWNNAVVELDGLTKSEAKQAAAKQDAEPKPEAVKRVGDGILRVLGPTFTGSLPSLGRDLASVAADSTLAQEFPGGTRVLSGSVTSCSEIQRFERQAKNGQQKISFGTFQENDALHIFRFLDYIAGQGIEAKDVAILSEDETAYAALPGAGANPATQDPCDFPYLRDNRPMHLTFPRDISALRDAYEKESVFDSGNGLKDHGAHPILRDIAGSETSIDDITDTIPAYSGSVSAVAQEAYLYGVVSFLRTHHARYLMLRCTNPLDFLFLTRFFHRAYPDARIVTVGSDMLFRREIDTTEFRGVLSLSSYPLLPRGQHWSKISEEEWEKEPHEHLVFESHLSEGIYIAARYLLQPDSINFTRKDGPKVLPLVVQQSDLPRHALQLTRAFAAPDYADPFWFRPAHTIPDLARPATWLTVVGRDGYWPIAVLGTLDEAQAASKPHLEPTNSSAPTSTLVQLKRVEPQDYEERAGNHNLLLSQPLPWVVAVMLSVCLICYQIWGMLRGNERSSDGIFYVFRKVADPSLILMQSLSSAIAVMPLLELTCVRFIPDEVERISNSNRALLWWFGVSLCALVVLARMLILRWRAAAWKTTVCRPLTWALGCYLLPLAGFAVLGWYAFWPGADGTNQVPLFYRMSHLTDGVSPLLPILLLTAGLYLWAWQAMAGNLIVAKGCPSLPEVEIAPLPPAESAASSRANSVAPAAKHPLRSRYRWLIHRYHGLIGDRGPERDAACLLPPSAARVSQALGRRIRNIAHPLSITLKIAVVPLLLIFAAVLCFGFRNLPLLSLESKAFNQVINLSLLFALVLTSAEAARMYWTWTRLRKLLHALGRLRLRRTLAQLRPIEANSIWAVSGNVRRFQYGLFIRQFEAANRFLQLQSTASGIQPQLDDLKIYGSAFIERTEKAVDAGAAFDDDVTLPGQKPVDIRDVTSDEAAHMYRFLSDAWERETDSLDLTGPGSETDAKEKGCTALPLSKCEKVQAAEEFLSYHYIAFIQNIVARMRTMTLSMIFLFVAVCFAISFYPFVPRTEIAMWMMLNLALIGGAVAYVYAGMERDEIMSYIANSKPGQLGGEFWLKLGGFLIGPVIGILTTQFPSIADTVLQWLQPGLDAIH